MVAGFSPDQQTAFGNVNNAQGMGQPYINQASAYNAQGAAPVGSITGEDINRYYNPWQQSVINSTMANINETNSQQQQQLTGNAAMQGALGGDRVRVAQSELARQQNLAGNQTLANLSAQGFTQAAGIAGQQQQNQQVNAQRAGQAAYTAGSLGQEAQGLALSGAQAQLGTGGLQQQLAQQNLNWPYQQYMMAQAYPYQQTQWLAGIEGGIGSQAGGTSNSVTTPPPPNPLNSIAGLGVAGAGLYMGNPAMVASGAKSIFGGASGGRVGYDTGGTVMPYSGQVAGIIPQPMQLGRGSGPPRPQGQQQQGQPNNAGNMANNAVGLANALRGAMKPQEATSLAPPGADPYASAGVGSLQPPGLSPTAGFGDGSIYARGGFVDGYDDGGGVPFVGPEGEPMGFRPPPQPQYQQATQGIISAITPEGEDIAPGLGRPPPYTPPDALHYVPYTPGEGAPRPPEPIAEPGVPMPRRRPEDAPRPPLPEPGLASLAANPLNPNGGVAQRSQADYAPNPAWSLVTAGLGMMASKSPYFGVAAGEGGLAGMQQYAGQQKSALEAEHIYSESAYKKAQAQHLRDQAVEIAARAGHTNAQTDVLRSQLAGSELARSDPFLGPGRPSIGEARTAPPPAVAVPAPGAPSPGAAGPRTEATPDAMVTAAHDVATRAVGLTYTPEGLTTVDAGGQPIENLAVTRARAERMIRIGTGYNLPQMVSAGEKLLGLVDTSMKMGTQLTNDGSVIPLRGAAETAARAEFQKTRAGALGTLPADIFKSAFTHASRAITVGPDQVSTTGLQNDPNLQAAIEWSRQQSGIPGEMNGAAPGATAPGRRADGLPAPGDPGISAFTPGLVRVPGGMASTVTPGSIAIQKQAAKQYEDAGAKYEAAHTAMYRLDLINHDIEALNDGKGIYKTGALGAERFQVMKGINGIFQTMGAPPPFDENKIGTWEDMSKTTFQLGAALARTMGAREAMQIVQQSVAANPGISNTPAGARMVVNSLKYALQMDMDYYTFATNYAQAHGGDLVGADVAFREQHPSREYAAKAIVYGYRGDNSDIEKLKLNPDKAADFDAKFGAGTAAMILGPARSMP